MPTPLSWTGSQHVPHDGPVHANRQGSRENRTRLIFYFLGLFCVIGWLYVFFMSDLFTINDIRVTGLQTLDPVDVNREVYQLLDQKRGWMPWPARNVWFIDRNQLAADLKTQLFAESVTVDKSYTNILRLNVTERASRLIFHSHQQYVWVDLQGLVTMELNDDERRQLQSRLLGQRIPNPYEPPVIQNNLDELVAVGYRVAEPTVIKTWVQTATDVMDGGIPYRELIVPKEGESTASIISPDGYPVYIDILKPLAPQLKTYKAFKEARTNFKVSEYLDVRIPGKIFYK